MMPFCRRYLPTLHFDLSDSLKNIPSCLLRVSVHKHNIIERLQKCEWGQNRLEHIYIYIYIYICMFVYINNEAGQTHTLGPWLLRINEYIIKFRNASNWQTMFSRAVTDLPLSPLQHCLSASLGVDPTIGMRQDHYSGTRYLLWIWPGEKWKHAYSFPDGTSTVVTTANYAIAGVLYQRTWSHLKNESIHSGEYNDEVCGIRRVSRVASNFNVLHMFNFVDRSSAYLYWSRPSDAFIISNELGQHWSITFKENKID